MNTPKPILQFIWN